MRNRGSLRSAFVLALLVPVALSAQITGDPPARVGRISSILGNVSFQAAGSPDWSAATLNYTVTTGDRLFTGQGARSEMEVGPFAVRLADSTDLNVVNLTDSFAQLGLTQGTLRVSVYRLERGDSMEVDTPNGALIVRDPGEYRVEIPANGNSTLVYVEQGKLDVSGPNLDATIRAGQTFELSGTGPIQFNSTARPRQTDFDRWSDDRDRRVATSDCTRYVSADTPGCEDLSDHGHWDEHTIYGPVWYPTHVAVGWAPYRYGRWVWVEPWGWTWVEDEPWGFAPFHYGRWVTLGGIWCWAPGPIGRPFYGPAFVSFVGGPGYGFGLTFGVHAWFPLGPREPYFPWYHHGDRYLRDVNYRNVRNVTNINVFIDERRATQMVFANREHGTTVVSTETFRSGREVGREAVNVRPDQISHAPIATHPWVTPTRTAAIGGAPVGRAPAVERPTMTTTGGRPQTIATRDAPRGGQPIQRTPLVARNAPPTDAGRAANPSPRQSGAPGTASRPADSRPADSRPADSRPADSRPADSRPADSRPADSRPADSRPADSRPAGQRPETRAADTRPSVQAQPRGGRTLITRNQPPAETPPFDARERAMQQNPGRPLEPQQMDNVRRGQPAGPSRDAAPRQAPARQSEPARSGNNSGANKKPPRGK